MIEATLNLGSRVQVRLGNRWWDGSISGIHYLGGGAYRYRVRLDSGGEKSDVEAHDLRRQKARARLPEMSA